MKSAKKPARRWALAALLGLVGACAIAFGMRTPPAPPPPQGPRVLAPAGPAQGEPIEELMPLAWAEFEDFELIDIDDEKEFGLGGVVPTLSDLQIPVTKRTLKYVAYFAQEEKGRRSFLQRFKRGSRLRDTIERAMSEGGLPQDLVWLAAIESAFRPQAASDKGAVGLFQFMPATAMHFGLVIDDALDERRSISRSTEAAVRYLDVLYKHYGAWDLALAAYNCGEYRLDVAIERAEKVLGKRDVPPDFHELAERRLLPKETSDFVPMIHAFAIVAHNLAQLDLDDAPTLPPMSLAEIAVPGNTPLSMIARAADMSVSDLQEYNPQFLVDATPDVSGDVMVSLPPETLDRARAALPTMIARASEPEEGDDLDIDALSAEKSEPAAPKPATAALTLAPGEDHVYLLRSGTRVVVEATAAETFAARATVVVRDPDAPEQKPLATHTTDDARVPVKGAADLLRTIAKDVGAFLRADVAPKLYASTLESRRAAYARVDGREAFEALSRRMFGRGHPLRGALLVGPTRTANDLIVDIEPTWTVEITLTLRGRVDLPLVAGVLEEVFVDPLSAQRLPRLPPTGETKLVPAGTELLVGWGSRANSADEEAAWRMAVLLACDDRLGRLSELRKTGRGVASKLACGYERSPMGNVAWVQAVPGAKTSVDELERAVIESLVGLTGSGPSDDEVDAARDLLRVDTQKRRKRAPSSLGSKRALEADAERVTRTLDDVTRDDVMSAARWVFNTHHRVTVTYGD